MAVTLKDVAEAAGVSITAVSKVLHGSGKSVRIGLETQKVIRETAERLQYYPSAVARSLRTGTTRTVGLVFENFGELSAGPMYYVLMLDGVARELFRNHYRLTILPEIEHSDVAPALSDGRMDGVIWCKLPAETDLYPQIRRTRVPVVALNAPAPENHPDDLVYVFCDNDGGARLVVEHLAELGHAQVLFVMERGEEETPDATARLSGAKRACAERGLGFEVATWSREAWEFADWWRAGPTHTALFAWNERVASEILKRCRETGVSVPGDVSVVGFDSTPYCDTTSPRLTAVKQPILEMAGQATRVLLDMIEGTTPDPRLVVFPCSLDVRDSTSSPRSAERVPRPVFSK
ncbi:MAG: LacI family DNA-binding transcriptional regulator [Fimbriimonadaceae bacterium]|nr:LacI family DNA-binding transcriptional regulator [Fimbriimonadaceae bacterium]